MGATNLGKSSLCPAEIIYPPTREKHVLYTLQGITSSPATKFPVISHSNKNLGAFRRAPNHSRRETKYPRDELERNTAAPIPPDSALWSHKGRLHRTTLHRGGANTRRISAKVFYFSPQPLLKTRSGEKPLQGARGLKSHVTHHTNVGKGYSRRRPLE